MKVLVLAGTEDGKRLASKLQTRGYQVLVSTLTEYGAEIAQMQGLKTRSGALDKDSFSQTLREKEVQIIIDATHPYARNIQGLARQVAQEYSLPYFRWERPSIDYPDHPLIHFASHLEEAAHLAVQLGKRIFLSTGSKNLGEWLAIPDFNQREIFVRVLPTSQILSQCEALGLKPYQIIGMQGPFNRTLNRSLWEQLNIEVVITKESGKVGGTDEKVQACLELGIPVIILERPLRNKPKEIGKESNEELDDFIRKVEKSIGC